MDWQKKMSEIIDYLESRMCEEIDLEKAARFAGYSVWEFQRIFAFLTNTTVGAYIRKRKLSLALQEIISSDEKIIDIAIKYGYESPTAFSRAFSQLWLTSWHHQLNESENNPLLGKKVGVFTYCSCFICQDDDLKNIFRKFLVTEEWTGKGGLSNEAKSYRFFTDEYLLNLYATKYSGLPGPDNVFNHDIIEYVKSVALWLK